MGCWDAGEEEDGGQLGDGGISDNEYASSANVHHKNVPRRRR